MSDKILMIFVIFLLFTGCVRHDRDFMAVQKSDKFLGAINKEQFKPRAYRNQIFDHTPNPVPTEKGLYEGDNYSYEQGWADGCQTATSAIGSGLYRLRGPKVDGDKLSHDPWYLRGYQDASIYCTLTLDWETH